MRIKFLTILLSFALFACSKGTAPTQKPTLLVSLAPYEPIVQRIAGANFSVHTMVPPGANPHSYEPTAKQVQGAALGIIWFQIGESFENKVFPVLQERNPQLLGIDLRQNVSLLHGSCCHHHHDEMEDRHFWLSPKTLMIQAHTIASTLAKQFPDQSQIFFENEKILLKELTLIDSEIATILAPIQHRSFLVSHPAFAYFCKDYHLSQISIEYRGKEPTSKYLTQIVEEIQATETKLALAMPQHSNQGVESLSKKLHLDIQTIDPYASDCFATMRLLAHMVADHE